METNVTDTTYKRTTRRFFSTRNTPEKMGLWQWLLLICWLILLLYGAFKIAPEIQQHVKASVQDILVKTNFQDSQNPLNFTVTSDGQNVHVEAIAEKQHTSEIEGIVSTATCDTWLMDDLRCVENAAVILSLPIIDKPIEISTSTPSSTPLNQAHNFELVKSNSSLKLQGEVTSDTVKESIIALLKNQLTEEMLVVTGAPNKFDDSWAHGKAAKIISMLEDGSVTWLNGVLSITGTASEKNIASIKGLLSSGSNPNSIGEIKLFSTNVIDSCNDAFAEALNKNSIQFESGGSNVSQNSILFLKELSNIAVSCEMSIVIEGHTDSTGDSEFNKRLSLARAESVVYAFISHGIDKSRLTAMGFGAMNPIASNSNSEGRRLNRRIEIKVSSL